MHMVEQNANKKVGLKKKIPRTHVSVFTPRQLGLKLH